MRRRLIKYEQSILPFIVDEGTLRAADAPAKSAGEKYDCGEIRLTGESAGNVRMHIAGKSVTAHFELFPGGVDLVIDGFFYRLHNAIFRGSGAAAKAQAELRSEIPGRIVKVCVAAGDAVEPGTVLIVQEAMKTEMSLKATSRAVVRDVLVTEGMQVDADSLLLRFADDKAEG